MTTKYIYRLIMAHSGKELLFRTCQENRKSAEYALRQHIDIMGQEVRSVQFVGKLSYPDYSPDPIPPDSESPQMAKKV